MASSVKNNEEWKARIEANRKKALERLLQKRQEVRQYTEGEQGPKRIRPLLTEEQKRRIEENRKKALEIRRQKGLDAPSKLMPDRFSLSSDNDLKSGSVGGTSEIKVTFNDPKKPKEDKYVRSLAGEEIASNIELGKGGGDTNQDKHLKSYIRKRDYIEYDLSEMKDSHGGFINMDENDDMAGAADKQTLDEWKEKQDEVVREAAPPLDISKAPKCFECGSIEIDQKIYDNFNHTRVCRSCKRTKSEKYSLLTKTECREDYLLTDPELQDKSILPRIEKPNPHGFSRMQLFLRYQVEEFAWKKWGSPEKLDAEWERRESMRIERKEKRYSEKLLEMRKKTRAEQYIKKLRNGLAIGERHVHDWSDPVTVPDDPHTVRRRCIECGLEIEQAMI